MKTIIQTIQALALMLLVGCASHQASQLSPADSTIRFSGELLKYTEPAGSPRALYCLRPRNHVSSNLSALWLVGVDLSHLENGTKVLVEGTIHTKLIPWRGGTSSIPNYWEIWMEVKRYKVITDYRDEHFVEQRSHLTPRRAALNIEHRTSNGQRIAASN